MGSCEFALKFVFFCVLFSLCYGLDVSVTRKIRECLGQDYAVICLKEKALDALNETIMSDKPLHLYGMVDIVRDPNYVPNSIEDAKLPEDIGERSSKLNSLLYDKVEEFFESRSVKINLSNVFEGRGKKGGGGGKGGKGGMIMMGGLAMAGMMAQMFMGKIAFMAGAALIIAKIALMMSTIIGVKKLNGGGGGGGETQHVVYAASGGGDGYGHSHGGWHRSLNTQDVQNIVYRGHMNDNF